MAMKTPSPGNAPGLPEDTIEEAIARGELPENIRAEMRALARSMVERAESRAARISSSPGLAEDFEDDETLNRLWREYVREKGGGNG